MDNMKKFGIWVTVAGAALFFYGIFDSDIFYILGGNEDIVMVFGLLIVITGIIITAVSLRSRD